MSMRDVISTRTTRAWVAGTRKVMATKSKLARVYRERMWGLQEPPRAIQFTGFYQNDIGAAISVNIFSPDYKILLFATLNAWPKSLILNALNAVNTSVESSRRLFVPKTAALSTSA